MNRYARKFAFPFLAIWVLPCAAADQQQLHNNPFSRPAAFGSATDPIMGEATAGGGLQLRGVLIAGDESVANIGGVIVPVGGEVNGYRLISVSDRQAVLEKEGVRTLLVMEKQ